MTTLRLFFALQPTLDQSANVIERAGTLLAQLPAQAVPAANLHSTLSFLGEVAPEKLDDLRAVAAGVRGGPATLCFDAFEYWLGPKIVCATATENAAALPVHGLAQALATALLAAGFSPDVKPFRAHLTLARKVSATDAAKVEWPQSMEPALLVHCDRFVLMQSQRGESGSIYSVVDSWPLDADNSR